MRIVREKAGNQFSLEKYRKEEASGINVSVYDDNDRYPMC